MEVLINVSQWVASNIFRQPASLIALIAFLGLIVQQKSFSEIISGTIKTVLGFVIIRAGSGIIVRALKGFGPMWQEVFGMKHSQMTGIIGTQEFISQFGSSITLIMTLGFLVNVALARFTRFKFIYLTGHMMFWVSFVYTGIMVEVFGTGISQFKLVLSGAIILGLYWTLQPAFLQKYVKKATGKDNIALGHTVASGAWLGAVVGKLIGDPENSTENLELPNKLKFLKDSNVVIVAVMVLAYVIGAILAGPEFMTKYAGDKNHIIYGVLQGLKFGAGIAVVLHGVKLLIGEIVPAFKGISNKLVPDSKPALDVPILYPYAPIATIVSFIASFVTMVILMLIMGLSGFYVFVPPMIAIFFHAAGAGVLGNATGGVKGAIASGVIIGIIITLGQAIFVKYITPTTIPDFILWGGDTDMFVFGTILKWVVGLFG
ncbi:hypothetical protein Halha_0789 [Halobacteroides halobius DSM 5150]|uniref:Ascorbate-specific PTS system EIIC component n=1 Tax=Halobacteroides halobius (strain ATCC 35273 / DSM 5150 / MD-1) TaxID=748449 RepID=L0K889_HALHC|nr:PTS ascorbate transporter subunit IIC [Halobacteroides halobius]AGB40760.1 hypothetical protein Halha_0789 [Halobacteroides halobius DSM 5150]